MDRRTFLKTSTAAAAVTTTAGAAYAHGSESRGATDKSPLALSSPAKIHTRHELRLAVPTSRHIADAAAILSREIESISEGRILLQCSETPIASAGDITSGRFNAAFGIVAEICNAPPLSLFSGLPADLALSPDNLLTWHIAGAGDMFLDDAANEHGMTAMIAGHSGARTGLWANRKLTDLRDFATAQIETIGLGRDIVRIIRAAHDEPAIKPASAHIQEAAASLIGAYGDIAEPNRRIWYREGLHDQGHALMLMIERETWGKLRSGDQLLLRTIARSAAHRDLATVKADDRLVAPSIVASLPTLRAPLPADILMAIRFSARQVAHENLTHNARILRAFEAYQSFYQAMMGAPFPRPVNSV